MTLALTGTETVGMIRDIVVITFLLITLLLALGGAVMGLIMFRKVSRVAARVERTIGRVESAVSTVESTASSVRGAATMIRRGGKAGSMAGLVGSVLFRRSRRREKGSVDSSGDKASGDKD